MTKFSILTFHVVAVQIITEVEVVRVIILTTYLNLSFHGLYSIYMYSCSRYFQGNILEHDTNIWYFKIIIKNRLRSSYLFNWGQKTMFHECM